MDEADEKTEFTFDELSPEAKKKALSAPREPHDEWWDDVYYDAVTVGDLLGINIGTLSRNIKRYAIFFSGFSSQSDGASYVGYYAHPKADIAKAVAEHAPKDAELKRIAESLAVLQVQCRLTYGGFLRADITTRGRYCHSGTMQFDVAHTNDEVSGYSEAFEELQTGLERLLRDFADWIYDRLEDEYDYLTSEEAAIEDFNSCGRKFDEGGVML